MKHLLCILGIHDYGRAHYTDLGFRSNVLDYKQKCRRCNHVIRWTQPKGVDYRFYPKYIIKNFWPWLIGAGLLIILLWIILR
jgi:hypothetical protein